MDDFAYDTPEPGPLGLAVLALAGLVRLRML
jgi:MYXO-CTERM domain-containing protein